MFDSSEPKKLLEDFAHMLKQQATFFFKVKAGDETKDQTIFDEKMAYFKTCIRNQVLCFPFLNKVHDHTLVLQNVVLSEGTCHAIKSVFLHVPHLVYNLTLSSNAMAGPQTQLILEGVLAQQGTFKSLTIQDNTSDE